MRLGKVYVNDEPVELANLTIIVGSNGVGKTTFLKDLHLSFVNVRPNGDSATTVATRWPKLCRQDSVSSTLHEWKEWLESIKVVTGEPQNNQSLYALPQSLGREQKPQRMFEQDRTNALEYVARDDAVVERLENSWAHVFRDQHAILLSVDNRFYVSNNSTGQLNPDTTSSLQPAPFLALNPNILKRINRAVAKLFDKKLFVESPLFPTYNILVGKVNTPLLKHLPATPQGYLGQRTVYNEWLADNTITAVTDEGHGIRAALELLYASETYTNKIIFIDEPELHLYPSSKYQLGRIIGSYANSSRKQIILSTHDSDFLRGLLHSARGSTVIRINKDRTVRSVSGKVFKSTSSNEVLQGSFLDAVLLAEGITDQFVYRNVFQQKGLLEKYSYQFLSSNGKQAIADDIPFYRSLGIGFAVILDYDSIFDTRRDGLIRHVLAQAGVLAREINGIQLDIDHINQFSKGTKHRKRGISNPELSREQIDSIVQLIDKLAGYGVFICPYGELEDWVGLSKPVTPERIYSRYRSAANTKYKKLTEFALKIEEYIRGEIL